MKTVVNVVGSIAAVLSAICWVRAAALNTPVLATYWDGPPKEVADRLEAQSSWNSRAAWFAALAAATMAIQAWL
jgi:hypothetical protein